MLRYTLRQLEYFSMVAELGSIAGASKKLNVTSPSISAAIVQLENELGLKLFVRRHALGLALTPAGKNLLSQVYDVLQSATKLVEVAGELSGNIRGPLSVGCLLTFAQVVFPSLRKEYEREFPDVKISQFELNQGEIFSQLRRSEINIALTYDLDVPSDLKFISLIELPPYAIMSQDHPLAKKSEVSIDELKDHPMVLLDLPHSSDYFLSFFTQRATYNKISERTKDMAVMRSLVANGFGYSIANVRPLNDQSPDGKTLRHVPIKKPIRALNMGLVMVKGNERSNLMQSFINHCTKMIKSKSVPGLEFTK